MKSKYFTLAIANTKKPPVYSEESRRRSATKSSFSATTKPLYVAGPNDSPETAKRIIRQLRATCGEGNFEYFVPIEEDSLTDDVDEFLDIAQDGDLGAAWKHRHLPDPVGPDQGSARIAPKGASNRTRLPTRERQFKISWRNEKVLLLSPRQRVPPVQAFEAVKIHIRAEQVGLVLDGERGEVGVGSQIASRPQLLEETKKTFRKPEGADRSRSGSEAFLYRRWLETLSETKGRFRLNAKLPIPFDNLGQMEADLLCAGARLVIEIDGAQHLADAEAYRRDRRKDALLQQNGYFILRFLTEDIGKRLDQILDAILAALTHRRKQPSHGEES